MKKVLVITYYWPPGGGAGVQRWLKFVKYLRDFGWEPVVYTPENGEMPVEDHSLMKDVPQGLTVIRKPIWEPYSIYKKFIGQKKEQKINAGFLSESSKPKLSEKVSVWIRGNLFIPDARRFWIKPSVNFLSSYLQQHPVDAIISTGPPHSMHLIAMRLERKLNIPWIADFRDPWTNIDFYEDLMLSGWADKKHHRLEKEVLTKASCILTIGETMKQEFVQMGAKNVEVITNGYDEEDLFAGEVKRDKKFSIAHIGSLVKSRNPEVLWKALSKLVKEDAAFASDLELKLVGKVDFHVIKSIEDHGLKQFLNKIDYLPHNDIIRVQQESQLLLLLINNTKNAKGILTGKFFEYLSAKRPILCIGPGDGDAAHILSETNAGKISGFDDEDTLKHNLRGFYSAYTKNELVCESRLIEKYSRRELTHRLAELLHSMVGK
jgi:glycosyltransferase involved in cell wall biosynthesis